MGNLANRALVSTSENSQFSLVLLQLTNAGLKDTFGNRSVSLSGSLKTVHNGHNTILLTTAQTT